MLNSQALGPTGPFAMLLDLEQVVRAMEHSERLGRLHSRIYRPLDKPLIPKGRAADTCEFDRMVDDEPLDEAMDAADTVD
jgi:hypothetical protein